MEASRFFEKILSQYKNGLPFVAFCKPESNTIEAILQDDDELYKAIDFLESGFVFAPFDNIESTILIPTKKSTTISCLNTLEADIKSHERIHDQDDHSKRKTHVELIEKAITGIHQDQFSKVVISRHEEVTITHAPIDVFKLLLSYKNAFVYCWYHPKIGLWLGATPETLFQLKGKRLTTVALAGTQTYSDNVNWTAKEYDEQQCVTDFIIENLNDLTTNLNASETQTVKAGHLAHLKTRIVANIKEGISLKEIISKLHPTPAVCGLPRDVSKAFILEYENYNREFYTGFLGFINRDAKLAPRSRKSNIEDKAYQFVQKQTDLFVNLRCMKFQKDNAFIYIGGGITKSSNPENEWDETVNKSMVMKRILNT